jgi:hypothetical protein
VKNIVSGLLSGKFDLRFISKENQNIAATLNGVAQIQMGPGRIARVPAIVSGTFAKPKFAPDPEQMAKMKLRKN